jgi:hypothetical protein
MDTKLRDVNVPSKLVTMKGLGHGWLGKELVQTLDQTMTFFEEKLKK